MRTTTITITLLLTGCSDPYAILDDYGLETTGTGEDATGDHDRTTGAPPSGTTSTSTSTSSPDPPDPTPDQGGGSPTVGAHAPEILDVRLDPAHRIVAGPVVIEADFAHAASATVTRVHAGQTWPVGVIEGSGGHVALDVLAGDDGTHEIRVEVDTAYGADDETVVLTVDLKDGGTPFWMYERELVGNTYLRGLAMHGEAIAAAVEEGKVGERVGRPVLLAPAGGDPMWEGSPVAELQPTGIAATDSALVVVGSVNGRAHVSWWHPDEFDGAAAAWTGPHGSAASAVAIGPEGDAVVVGHVLVNADMDHDDVALWRFSAAYAKVAANTWGPQEPKQMPDRALAVGYDGERVVVGGHSMFFIGQDFRARAVVLLAGRDLVVGSAWSDEHLPSTDSSQARGVALTGQRVLVVGEMTTGDGVLSASWLLDPELTSSSPWLPAHLGSSAAVTVDVSGRWLVHSTLGTDPFKTRLLVWDQGLIWSKDHGLPVHALATSVVTDAWGYVYAGKWTAGPDGHTGMVVKHHP